ncbi:Hyaluronan synthase [Acaryochloris thomasi RCC1774]|uniref:Hyaluronan synthase n=1 Tax=Acaryochloris thomasi RCC1774 TaxID=1764569 RepID=A0A2W1JXA7_9CYAN|nr:glycosyltransferase [Acaryochloris thomasi]PZD74244.1 Hyaluronan synthase [Acaryochloris thomasi RCC1774]
MENSARPLLSIIIPTYNRPERLSQCLQALTQQTLSTQSWEVVVVDDGSEQSMEPVIATVQSQIQIRLIRQSNSGPAKARNTGAESALGQYLVFTDDDCAPKPDWLAQFAHEFEQKSEGLIGGHTLNALEKNLYSTTSQLLIDYLYSYYNGGEENARFFASNNFALPADLFHQIGGFDTNFPLAAGEDREFCDRISSKGYAMYYAPEAIINHAHHLTFKSFWRQHFNYGRGAFYFHAIRANRKQDNIKVEPISFYAKLLSFPFMQPTNQPSFLVSLLLFMSQVANVMGFFWAKKQAT